MTFPLSFLLVSGIGKNGLPAQAKRCTVRKSGNIGEKRTISNAKLVPPDYRDLLTICEPPKTVESRL
jgi:hypothetical protein